MKQQYGLMVLSGRKEQHMGIFDIDEDRIKALYKKASYECDRGFVNSRDFPELDDALIQFATENDCTYDEAYILAKTGEKLY